MIDLSKLTPAPFTVNPSVHRDRWILNDAEGDYVATYEDEDEAQLAALARNAFDVNIRRGWHAYLEYNGCWTVMAIGIDLGSQAIRDFYARSPLYWGDPFTAIVEADKWYRENVESKK